MSYQKTTARQNAAGEWRCTKCNEYKPIERYNFDHARSSRYPLCHCKDCKAALARKYRAAKRADNPVPYQRGNYFPPYGSRHWRAKLNEADVALIKQLLPDLSAAAIARKFEVSPSTIMGIKHGHHWSHVA